MASVGSVKEKVSPHFKEYSSHQTNIGLLDFSQPVTGGLEIIFNSFEWGAIYSKVKNEPERYENEKIREFLTEVFENNARKVIGESENQEFSRLKLLFSPGAKNNHTINYLKLRSGKKIAKSVFVTAFMAASPHTGGINVPSLGLNVDSEKNTLFHICKLVDINKKLSAGTNGSDSNELKKILGSIINKKSRKAFDKGVDIAFSSVPGGIIIGPAASNIVGLVKSSYNSVVKNADSISNKIDDGIKKVTKEIAGNTECNPGFDTEHAKLIHFLAFKEQFIKSQITDRKGGKLEDLFKNMNIKTTTNGTATAIFQEIFKQRGLSRIIHKYDPIAIIKEPLGWIALLGKLEGSVAKELAQG